MKRCSAEEKAMWLEDWKASGKSVWGYAKENGLNPQTFNKWARGSREVSQGCVEIKAQSLETARYTPEILIEKGNIKIHIPIGINRNDLQTVIQSLGCEL
jgi:transposase-like protein